MDRNEECTRGWDDVRERGRGRERIRKKEEGTGGGEKKQSIWMFSVFLTLSSCSMKFNRLPTRRPTVTHTQKRAVSHKVTVTTTVLLIIKRSVAVVAAAVVVNRD